MIDEFPVLLEGRDSIADEAETLLTELVRRGPENRLHLVLPAEDAAIG